MEHTLFEMYHSTATPIKRSIFVFSNGHTSLASTYYYMCHIKRGRAKASESSMLTTSFTPRMGLCENIRRVFLVVLVVRSLCVYMFGSKCVCVFVFIAVCEKHGMVRRNIVLFEPISSTRVETLTLVKVHRHKHMYYNCSHSGRHPFSRGAWSCRAAL